MSVRNNFRVGDYVRYTGDAKWATNLIGQIDSYMQDGRWRIRWLGHAGPGGPVPAEQWDNMQRGMISSEHVAAIAPATEEDAALAALAGMRV
jgi:hypothetical protein